MSQTEKPWYVELVGNIGGLGLVLVMMVGLYFLAEDFGDSLKDTLTHIESIEEKSLEHDKNEQARLEDMFVEFMRKQSDRMTEHSARMNAIEERMSKLSK